MELPNYFQVKKKTYQLSALILLLFITPKIVAQTIYVDNQLSTNCNGNYSITNRDCSGSDGNAYYTFATATSVATSGATVLIRSGIFSEQLIPQNSGNPSNYITFKNYESEVVEITGTSLSPAIFIENKDYIIIEGLQVRDVRRWLNALGSDYLIIRNNIFERALDSGGSSKTGLFFQSCNYTKIQNNILDDTTQDNLGMIDCDYNLIEGNTITKALHALWAFKCSNYNIIRNNYFHNELQKIGEIYDCDNAGFGSIEFPKLNSYDDAKYNVVEGNIFAYTPSSGNSSPYAGIQYAGQYGILRNNIFYECVGPALGLTIYSGEAENNYGNRIYHNVFYNNKLGAFNISGSTASGFYDQKIKNNILYENEFIQNDFRWNWYAELDNQPVQILTGRIQDVFFDNNNIFSTAVDELYIIAYGLRNSNSNEAPQPISWWETNRPNFIQNSSQANPMFVSPASYNFHLQENSPMIDAGELLANTTNAGANSTVMKVDDARWFTNGFGIVTGDSIQLDGQLETALIVSVNYTSNELTLDSPLSWNTGQGVSLAFIGSKPDLGAFEYNASLSIIDTAFNNPFSISPNPTTNIFTIDLRNAILEKAIIYNQSGQQVKEVTTKEVNISNLSNGIYFVKITSQSGKIAVKKVIKN